MDIRQALAKALKEVRDARNLTQEDFADVSSRTYMSTLERGLKSPTLDKLIVLTEKMQIHPLTLVILAYMHANAETNPLQLFDKIEREISQIQHTEKSA